jgi:tripartite-type tricarboxylate transporter receptor subunit TctC
MAEAGFPEINTALWSGLFVQAATPEPIVKKLNEEMVKILKDKEFADSMTAGGVDAAPTTPAELKAWVVSETKKWGELAKAANIQPE